MCDLVNVLKEFQTLATGVLAILAAFVGFGGVWYSQRSIARNAEKDREHRERVAKDDREHREQAGVRRREAERDHRRTVFIHAVTGELSANQPLIYNAANWARAMVAIYKKMDELSSGKELDAVTPAVRFQTSVYTQHIADIGLLPPTLTHSLVSVYTRLQVKVVDPENPNKPFKMTGIPAGGAVIAVDAMKDWYMELANDTHDLIMRLHSVRLGYDDPGADKGTEFYVEKFKLKGVDTIAEDALKSPPESSG